MPRSEQPGFQLPPEVTVQKEHTPEGWVFSFRHQELGQLGRIVLQERADGNTQVVSEVAGDPDDPMTERRKSVFGPIAMEIARQMDLATGGTGAVGPSDPPPYRSPPPGSAGFHSKHVQCDKCDAVVAVLIFADDARDAGGLEDCARLMFPKVEEWNLPTWVIGPERRSASVLEQPAPILKIWPDREPVCELLPEEFNPIIEKIRSAHCP